MWARLRDEYGTVADLQYAKAESDLRALKKSPKTSMQEHIDKFEKLREARDVNAPADVPPLKPKEVNLAFLASLGKDWRLFHQSLGTAVDTMKSGELYARVKAIDEDNDHDDDDEVQALIASHSNKRFKSNNNQHNKFQSNPESGQNSKYRRNKNNGNDNRNLSSIDRNKRCFYCRMRGHVGEDCFKKKWADTQRVLRRDNDEALYQPEGL
jgi:hypothetical protein